MPLVSSREPPITVRPLEDRDLAAVAAHAAHPEVARLANLPHPFPDDGALALRDWAAAARAFGAGEVFAIVRRVAGDTNSGGAAPEETIGTVTVDAFDDVGLGQARLAYWVAAPHWGHGIGTRAVDLALELAARHLRLHGVRATCAADNVASARVLEKNGFHETAASPPATEPGQRLFWRSIRGRL